MRGEQNERGPAGCEMALVVRIEPVLVGVEDAGRMLGVSAKSIRRMIADGELPSVLVGPGKGRRLLSVVDLSAWAAGLQREGGTAGGGDREAAGGGR